MIWAEVATALVVIGFVYTFLRNFKNDITARMDSADKRLTSLEERMFYMATGKTLAEAMILEKMKKSSNEKEN